MISAISWVPKGASKVSPVVVDPPSIEEIEEILSTGALEKGDVEEGEDMDVDASIEEDEVVHALAVAKALSNKGDCIPDKEMSSDIRKWFMKHHVKGTTISSKPVVGSQKPPNSPNTDKPVGVLKLHSKNKLGYACKPLLPNHQFLGGVFCS